ncbi:hypothetical protein D3C80_780410 [compost metagenome]
MAGENDVLLNFEEFFRFDRRQRVFLGVDRAVLQREIDFGECDRRGVGTAGARHGEIGRHVRNAHLHALQVGAFGDCCVRCRVASAVIADGGDDVAGLVLIPLGKALEDVALRIGD